MQSWASVWPYPVALRYCPRLAQTVNELLATEAYDLKVFQQTYTQERAIQRYAAFIGQQLW